jgi:hypothetical protein
VDLSSALLCLLNPCELGWGGRNQPQRNHVDSSTTGNHLDIRGSCGVLAPTGGEGSGNAEFFGEALSKEGVCSGSLVFVPMSSW